MSIKHALARDARGEILIPLLKRFLSAENDAQNSGKKSRHEMTSADADLTISAFKERKAALTETVPEGIDLFHPSSLGECLRKLWYHHYKAPTDGTKTAEDLMTKYVILEMGTYMHVMFQNLCQRAGYLKQREIGIISPKDKILGHGDGRLQFPVEDLSWEWWKKTKGQFLLEIKSTNPRQMARKTDADFGHKQQATAYMHALGLKATIFVYIELDRRQMKEFVFEYDPDFYEEHVKDRINTYFRKVKKMKAPEREGSNPRMFPCMFCPFTHVCFSTLEHKRLLKRLKNSHETPAPKAPKRFRFKKGFKKKKTARVLSSARFSQDGKARVYRNAVLSRKSAESRRGSN